MNEAGTGTRVVNFIVDTIIIFLLTYGVYKWYSFYAYYYYYRPLQFYVFFWATMFVYYLLFEMIFTRTPGKWITFTRVRSADGKRPRWYQIIVRSLIRLTLIDAFFIPLFNRTLHDQLSNTRVVEL